jgi:hypothetical protein
MKILYHNFFGFKSTVFNLSDEKNPAFSPFVKKFQADLTRHDFLRVL